MALILAISCCIHVTVAQIKLDLSSSNVIDIFGVYNTKMPVRNLLDEQQIAGDPLNDPNNALPCKTPWLPSPYNDYYPILYPEYPGAAAVIDLESLHIISNICIYIMNSTNWADFIITYNLTLYNPFEPPLLSFSTKITSQSANNWNCFNISNNTNIYTAGFITVSLHSQPGTAFTEIVVYGNNPTKVTHNSNDYKPQKPQPQEPKPLRYSMGTTGYGYTPTSNFSNTVGVYREWQLFPWIEGGDNHQYPGYPNNQNRYCNSTIAGPNSFCQDDVLQAQRKNNVSVHVCVWLQGSQNTWIHNWNQSEMGWKPIYDDILHQYGATVTPSSYIILADHLFQKTARYGRVAINHDLLKLAPNVSLNDSTPQPVLTGTDLLDWIEVWNEPNCGGGKGNREYWWSNIEIVAMQSAVYDGHLYSMPNTVGIKTADPSMNVSFGGLCGGTNRSATSDDFYGILYNWQTIRWWSDYYRNGSIPAEALAFHFYARNCTGCWPTIGVSPEQYGVYEMCRDLVQWRNQNMPQIQVWLTEWGYDTVSPSEILAPPIGSMDSEKVQGSWILRTILAAHAGGVDRTTQFQWNDGCASGSWCTTGLVDINYNPKKSYYYFVAMYRNLKHYFFVSRDCNGMNGNVCVQIYGYNGNYAYVVWCPTSKDQMVKDFMLHVGDVVNCELILPTVGNADGKKSSIKVNEEMVVLNVSELPVFVMTS